jgi:two-component system response regulator
MTGQIILLLVEDNPKDEALTLRALKKHNIEAVVVARDGAEALDYLFARGAYAARDPAAMPMLVLLDLKLPKLGGLEVLKQLRAEASTKLVPVVILTSSMEESDLVESYSVGANSYLRKPVDFTEFADAVRQLADYWLDLNEPPPTKRPNG